MFKKQKRQRDCDGTTKTAFQFDIRGLAVITFAVAAICTAGKQFLDAGAALTAILIPAICVFAIGSSRLSNRALLGAVAILVPIFGALSGVFIQCCVWGVVYQISWIPVATTCSISVLAAVLMLVVTDWGRALKYCCVFLLVLAAVTLLRIQLSSAERWAAKRFDGGENSAGRVRHQMKFSLPSRFGNDVRSMEGAGFRWLTSCRLILGVSKSESLDIHARLTSVEWKHVTRLAELRTLTVRGCSLNNSKLRFIGELKNLEELVFVDCTLLSGFQALSGLENLQEIGFHNSRIKNFEGIEKIRMLMGIGIYGKSYLEPSQLVEQVMSMPDLLCLEAPGVPIANGEMQALLESDLYSENNNQKWLESFSMDASTVNDEILIRWLSGRKHMTTGINRLGLSEEKSASILRILETGTTNFR